MVDACIYVVVLIVFIRTCIQVMCTYPCFPCVCFHFLHFSWLQGRRWFRIISHFSCFGRKSFCALWYVSLPFISLPSVPLCTSKKWQFSLWFKSPVFLRNQRYNLVVNPLKWSNYPNHLLTSKFPTLTTKIDNLSPIWSRVFRSQSNDYGVR